MPCDEKTLGRIAMYVLKDYEIFPRELLEPHMSCPKIPTSLGGKAV